MYICEYTLYTKPINRMILQKLKYVVENPLQRAERYFAIISVLNNLELAKREIQLLAFTAVRGNIGSASSKGEFVQQYDSSLATVGNIITKLSKELEGTNLRLLVKEGKKMVTVNRALLLDFNKGLVLQITLENAVEQTT